MVRPEILLRNYMMPKTDCGKVQNDSKQFFRSSVTCSTTMCVMTLAISFAISQTISSEKTLVLNGNNDTDDRRSGAPAIWGKVKIFKSNETF